MLQAILNIFKIADLRNKVLFTIGMLAVYRIGFWIPVPGINQTELKEMMQLQSDQGSAAGRMIDFVGIFSGGNFGQSTIFGLGIMPYISAAIIFQLLQSVSQTLKKLQQEGPTGRQKIQEWTRYATVAMCVVQAIGWLAYINGQRLIYPQWAENPLWWVMAVTAMTAGTTGRRFPASETTNRPGGLPAAISARSVESVGSGVPAVAARSRINSSSRNSSRFRL